MEKIQTTKEWEPSNGEKVWIKVFSNWSQGTYIGFDPIKKCHLVREDESGGGHLLSSKNVLPENANPNNIVSKPKKTGEYICRMENGYIKMCHWNGIKWLDMWETTLEGSVKNWMEIPINL